MITGASGRVYDRLPIDNSAGFPQRFPFLFNGVRYQFLLYAVVPEVALGLIDELMDLPDAVALGSPSVSAHEQLLKVARYLVVRVDVSGPEGEQQVVFLRKVVPSLEYRASGLMLTFPTQIIARRNLNNPGKFGSNVIGGATSL